MATGPGLTAKEVRAIPRTFAAAVLLAVLALITPRRVVAGPPEGASGRMVLDEVAEGLRKYRRARDAEARIELMEKLMKLAPTCDPRVAVALGERLGCGNDVETFWVAVTIIVDFRATLQPGRSMSAKDFTRAASVW